MYQQYAFLENTILRTFFVVKSGLVATTIEQAGEMPSLEPPNDDRIRTLYVGGLDKRIDEQDLREKFSAHGEIETIKMIPSRECAFVMYTSREGAEKAAEELSNMLVIKGQKLKLMRARPQTLKPESMIAFNGAREKAFGKVSSNNTIPRLQRTAPYYSRIQAHVCGFYSTGEMPCTTELSPIKDRYYGYVKLSQVSTITIAHTCTHTY